MSLVGFHLPVAAIRLDSGDRRVRLHVQKKSPAPRLGQIRPTRHGDSRGISRTIVDALDEIGSAFGLAGFDYQGVYTFTRRTDRRGGTRGASPNDDQVVGPVLFGGHGNQTVNHDVHQTGNDRQQFLRSRVRFSFFRLSYDHVAGSRIRGPEPMCCIRCGHRQLQLGAQCQPGGAWCFDRPPCQFLIPAHQFYGRR